MSTAPPIVHQKRGSSTPRETQTEQNCTRAAASERWKTQLQQLFRQWDALQDRGEATEQARAERERILKQMREILSNRTYVKNIVSDLVATIG